MAGIMGLFKFKNLELGHKDIFSRYQFHNPTLISEHTFTNLFIWKKSRPISILETNSALLVISLRDNCITLFGPPIGDLSLSDSLKYLEDSFSKPVAALERMPKDIVAGTTKLNWEIIGDKNNFDYVYRREDLATLAGRRYHNKRNLIAQCLSEYECKYEEIGSSNLNEVGSLMSRWCEEKKCGKDIGLCTEYAALKELFDNYGKLDVFGAAIRANGQLEAFTIGGRLNINTAVIHFEKATSNFKGLYQLINQRFCQNHLSLFEYVNREQDLGVEGLKKAKESYFPDHMIEKYKIVFDEKLYSAHEVRCPESP